MKKSKLTIKKRLLIIIGIFNLLMIIIVVSRIYVSWMSYVQAQQLQTVSTVIDRLYNVNRNLSLARAASLVMLNSTEDSQTDLPELLKVGRRNTDDDLQQAILYLQDNLGFQKDQKHIGDQLDKIKQRYQSLIHQRSIIDKTIAIPFHQRDTKISDQYFEVSQSLINEIQDFILIYSGYHQDISPMINQQVTFKYFVWTLAENTGMEYAIIGQLIANNRLPTAEERDRLASLNTQIEYDWTSLRKLSLSNDLAKKLNGYIEEANTHYFFIFEHINQLLGATQTDTTPEYLISTDMWFGLSSQVVDSLLVLQDEILKETQSNVAEMQLIAKRRILFSITIFICALVLSIYSWRVIVLRITRPINTMVDTLYNASMDELKTIDFNHQDEIEKLSVVLEAFKNKTNKLKQSNEELERFAFIAAHDLKTPLRAVESISEWLEEDLGDNLPAKSKKHISEMRSRIKLMDRLLDDTLEYARVETRMNPKTNELIVGKLLLDEIITLLNPPPTFTITIDHRLSEIILLRFPLQQVLYNLLRNALMHHDKPTGIIDIKLEETDKRYEFCVSDDGPGIDQRYHQKIFEMFQTLRPHDKNAGRGIGLAIVRKIIASNGEKIRVDSVIGKGSAFYFTWPKPTISDMLKYKPKIT